MFVEKVLAILAWSVIMIGSCRADEQVHVFPLINSQSIYKLADMAKRGDVATMGGVKGYVDIL
jgi:hypothetical protein